MIRDRGSDFRVLYINHTVTQVQWPGAALHSIRYRTRLWFRRALQHSRDPEAPGAALRAELLGRAQRILDDHSGLPRIRAVCGIRAVAGPAETGADLHPESIVIVHAVSLRESAHHAAYVISARRAPRSGCD